jgi:sugar lactone lactonase YvrE
MKIQTAVPARMRVHLLCAGVAALLCACGPGGPKRHTDEADNGGSTGPSAGISLLAGDANTAGRFDAKGGSARFTTPRGIAIDTNGNLYVADQGNFAIRKIAPDGTVSTFAGRLGASGTGNGKGGNARFSQPTAITIDGGGNLFVTDGLAIRKITPDGNVTTVTTFPSGVFGTDNTQLPAGIAVDTDGNLFVTTGVDTRRITIDNPGRSVQLEAGAVENVSGANDVVPRGVAVDAEGTAYVADLNKTISSAKSGVNFLTRFVGTAGRTGKSDGSGTVPSFQQVVALTVDSNGDLYAADAINNTVRKITKDAVVTTPAGTAGSTTLRTGKLPGSFAPLHGITTDGNGTLYATSGNAVVKIVLP